MIRKQASKSSGSDDGDDDGCVGDLIRIREEKERKTGEEQEESWLFLHFLVFGGFYNGCVFRKFLFFILFSFSD